MPHAPSGDFKLYFEEVGDGYPILFIHEYAGIELEVFETPGHSAGHIIFLWRGDWCGLLSWVSQFCRAKT